MSGADSTVPRVLPNDEEAQDALGDELGRLTGNAAFRVAEFAADAATIFEVSRDEHGTPTAVTWRYPYEGGALQLGMHDEWSQALTDPGRFHRYVAPRLIVRTPHQLPGELRGLLPSPRHEVPVYKCTATLGELLRAAMKESPLLLGYELAVLKHSPAGQTGAARVVLTGLPLFSPGETSGRQVRIRVRCEPTDAEGTALAVVTREPRPDVPRQLQRLRPLQVHTAMLRPGTYDLTGVLIRPGKVRFDGLGVPLGRSGRSWDDLMRLVPAQLAGRAPVHLVCLIEVCGVADRMEQRVYRLEELVAKVQAAAGPLRVSVVAYGAHGVAWKVDDRPPQIRAWAASGDEAVNALRGLIGRRVDERDYQRAAQLECALQLVRRRLRAADGRPVIVTAGGRQPHPPGLDLGRQLIPCPEWVDWWSEFGRLSGLPGIAFGALRDSKSGGGVWEQLGRHAQATVDDAVDMESFAEDLGLLMTAQTVPFPVIE